MVCKTIKPNFTRVCIGDLKHKIKVQFTSSKGNNAPNQNASVAFSDVVQVWAMIKTTPVFDPVSGVNTENGINTDFYIRFTSDIDFTKPVWVEYQDVKYKITGIENIDKQDHFVRLRSTERGSKALGAALR